MFVYRFIYRLREQIANFIIYLLLLRLRPILFYYVLLEANVLSIYVSLQDAPKF